MHYKNDLIFFSLPYWVNNGHSICCRDCSDMYLAMVERDFI